MRFYPSRSVEEQANRLPEELREAYKNSQLDRITIFDGYTELVVTGYAEYSYLEEKSYKTQPVRTQDGAIQEIEQYATLWTPRLIIKYNMMNIDDYRAFMKMIKRRNGFIVKCYDVVEDKIVRNEMYVATPSMPIIYQQYLIAMGIQEYAIELIGTNIPIVSENEEEEGTPEISFTVATDSYKARLGYTWRDFVGSKYDVYGEFSLVDTIEGSFIIHNGLDLLVRRNGIAVTADEYILKDTTYSI